MKQVIHWFISVINVDCIVEVYGKGRANISVCLQLL